MTLHQSLDVSIILPIHNGEPWLQECLDSVVTQDACCTLELSVYFDFCTDGSKDCLLKFIPVLEARNIKCTWSENTEGPPFGVGFAKNRAVEQCSGRYLCFLDCDDVMDPRRIQVQHGFALRNPTAIVGSKFHREPESSTERYTKWANGVTPEQLYTQIYTSHGPSIIMPTWFCSVEVFKAVGKFSEEGKGTPEDLMFFYRHLRGGGKLIRVDEDLLMYRYHPAATTFSVSENTIWAIRIQELSERVLVNWDSFTIWNAGKQGRKFYRCLLPVHRDKVAAFCDVDKNKIAKGVYIFEESNETPKPRVPIIHFSCARPPLIICVKQDLTGGGFEENLKSLCLTEGKDYIYFS